MTLSVNGARGLWNKLDTNNGYNLFSYDEDQIEGKNKGETLIENAASNRS